MADLKKGGAGGVGADWTALRPALFEVSQSASTSVCQPISVDLGAPEVGVNDLEKGQSELS